MMKGPADLAEGICVNQQLPPPPPPRPDSPWAPASTLTPVRTRSSRPQLVTAAGIVLIVLGGLGLLGGLALAAVRNQPELANLDLSHVTSAVVALTALLGGLQAVAGILILRLSSGGRILGIVLSIIGVLGGLVGLSRGVGIVGLGANGFVLYALFANAAAFREQGSG